MASGMPNEVHLLVLIHGMWGTPKHLSEVQRIIKEKHETALWSDSGVNTEAGNTEGGTRLDVLVAQTNQTSSTYDGIDWGGERVAEEVYERVAKIEEGGTCKVTFFSIFGYSLGGLLGRYLIGILHSRKFFEHVKPINFTTFATPHIGLPRYRTLWSTFAATLGSKLLSRTGEQFYGADKWGKESRPLLEVMADKDYIFWRALSLFPHINIYANSVSDPTVPFVTAAIELEDPFSRIDTGEIEIKLDPEYGALIKSYGHISAPASSRFSFPSLVPSRPILPPFLRRGRVFETTLYVLSPVVVPAVFSIAVLRLTRDSRASRSRIKLLEADENSGSRLVNILDGLESAVESFIDPVSEQGQGLSPQDTSLLTPPASDHAPPSNNPLPSEREDVEKTSGTRCHGSDSQPLLTQGQIQMVHTLNELPQMSKHFAFFHPVRNAHGLIVCRDVEDARRIGGEWAAFLPQGEGLLRHWADGFVMSV